MGETALGPLSRYEPGAGGTAGIQAQVQFWTSPFVTLAKSLPLSLRIGRLEDGQWAVDAPLGCPWAQVEHRLGTCNPGAVYFDVSAPWVWAWRPACHT